MVCRANAQTIISISRRNRNRSIPRSRRKRNDRSTFKHTRRLWNISKMRLSAPIPLWSIHTYTYMYSVHTYIYTHTYTYTHIHTYLHVHTYALMSGVVVLLDSFTPYYMFIRILSSYHSLLCYNLFATVVSWKKFKSIHSRNRRELYGYTWATSIQDGGSVCVKVFIYWQLYWMTDCHIQNNERTC